VLNDLAVGMAEPVGMGSGEGSAGRRHDLADRARPVIVHEWASVAAGQGAVNNDKIAVCGYFVSVPPQIGKCPAEP
jgi:hypothetical protein